jgi:Fe2+ transport system protein B
VNNGHLLKEGFFSGMHKGWDGFIWMMKILVPISLLTASLEWSGWIRHLDFLVQPVMKMLYLPPSAALPLLIGALSGI